MADNLRCALATIKRWVGRNALVLVLGWCVLLFAAWPATKACGKTQQSGGEIRALELGQPVER